MATHAGTEPEQIALDAVQLFTQQTVNDLVQAVPSLQEVAISEAPPLLELALSSFASERDLTGQTIGELLDQEDSFGQSQLSELGAAKLQNYPITAIPGLSDTTLNQFQGWTQAPISSIQPLPAVPIAAVQPVWAMGVARHDTTWGPLEQFATYKPITGGDEVGYIYACDSPRSGGGTGCATVELGDLNGSLGALGLDGAHYVKGGKADDAMQNPGGSGPLRLYNNGQGARGSTPRERNSSWF